MSFNEHIPQVYVLRYNGGNYNLCKLVSRDQLGPAYTDEDFEKHSKAYDLDGITARLVTAAHLGDMVISEDLLFPNINSPHDKAKPDLQKLIDKAYEVMSPESREARQKRLDEKKAAAK